MNAQLFQLLFYFVGMFWPKIRVSAAYPLAQAYHESEHWTSPLYLQGNNMFGMKPATKRSSSATGTVTIGRTIYAAYRSPLDSIRDYYKRLDYYNIYDDAGLLRDIKTNYATDPKYLAKVEATRLALAPNLISPRAAQALIGGGTLAAVFAGVCGVNALLDA
jgi:Mannosyl-glycoprotein endo-beta-N-acetylglucosaminidase